MQDKTTETAVKKIGFAIVGMGKLTETQLLPAFKICRLAKIAALVGSDASEMKTLGVQNNIPDSCIYDYENFDEIANNAAVQVVYIVLPNSKHKEFTIRSAKAGKHVLCEKPMATNIEDAQAMIDICKAHEKLLMIAYRIQYEAHHQLMREWVQQKVFGEVKVIECFNGEFIKDATQWRFTKALSGGGSLMDLGIYCINTMRYLTGYEPLWLSANTHSTKSDERFKEVEETVLFQMGFPDDLVITCGCSYSTFVSQRYRCHTKKDAWFGMDPAFAYKELKMEIKTSSDKDFPLPVVPSQDQFAVMMDHMADCVLHKKLPLTPGEEGLQDMKIIEAIYLSAKEQKVIALDRYDERDKFRHIDSFAHHK